MNRRRFLTSSASCSAHLLALTAFARIGSRNIFAKDAKMEIVAEEKWGRIEKIDDGIFAVVSTPFTTRDFTTVCNGGIIAGDDRVLAVESFMQPAGATWLAEQSEKLTGQWPTDVVSTHYHGDHTSGHPGYFSDKQTPTMWLTKTTKEAAEESFASRGGNSSFQNTSELSETEPTNIDLGNRIVRLVPKIGHTQSDIEIEVVQPATIWTGDLYFNRMFPNFSDATPTKLKDYAAELDKLTDTTVIPGHGPIANKESIERYREFLDFIEESARSAFDAGKTPEEASKQFKLPSDMSEWMIWSPDNATRAFAAWNREWTNAE